MWGWLQAHGLANVGSNGTALTGTGGALVAALAGAQYAAVSLAGPTTRTVNITTVNRWEALPTGTNFFSGVSGGSFAFNTTTGVVTYTGPTRGFALSANATLHKSGAGAGFLEIAVAKDSELVGLTTNVTNSEGAANTPPLNQNLFARRVTTLSNGDTFRAAFRNTGNTDDILVVLFTLSAEVLAS